MLQFIYFKISDEQESAYTSLTGLLKSENIERLYKTVRLRLMKGSKFQYNNITISKVKLNHFTNGKRK